MSIKRNEGESMEAFRARRTALNKAERDHLRGRVFWESKVKLELTDKEGKKHYRMQGLTYKRPVEQHA